MIQISLEKKKTKIPRNTWDYKLQIYTHLRLRYNLLIKKVYNMRTYILVRETIPVRCVMAANYPNILHVSVQ